VYEIRFLDRNGAERSYLIRTLRVDEVAPPRRRPRCDRMHSVLIVDEVGFGREDDDAH